MMKYATLIVDRVGEVGIIRLNAPKSLNAVTETMLEELDYAFVACSKQVRAIVLTSTSRAFSSGANLIDGGLDPDAADGIDAGALLETHVNPLFGKLKALEIPWISAIRGPTVGVACSIALAADMIVASYSAYLLLAFARVGLVPDGGAHWLLTRTIGRARAMELMLLGDRLPAATALQWGLVNRVVPDDQLEQAALEIAMRLAQGPTRTLALIRRLSWAAADQGVDVILAAERDAQRMAGQTQDVCEGIAAFVEKRQPRFVGA